MFYYEEDRLTEQSEWSCELIKDFVITPAKGNHPNWFWRKMQYLAFGFRWYKNETTTTQGE